MARSTLRTAVVWDHLHPLLAQQSEDQSRPVLDVLDIGGGTGGLAVAVAALGHRLTVVDPSLDALAALERRAHEAGLADRITAVQGEAGAMAGIGAESADVVVCHGVLEYVDDPAAAISGVTGVLRPRGVLSLLVAQRLAAVLARAVAGRFAEASRVLSDAQGHGGSGDPVPRRFDQAGVVALLVAAGLQIRDVRGVRMFSDLVPASVSELDEDASRQLLALERLASQDPTSPLVGLASQLHVVASR